MLSVVFVAELEDVSDFDGFGDFERCSAGGAGFAFGYVADVGDDGQVKSRPGVTLR